MDADLMRVAEGLPVDPETETMATAVLSGSGLMAAAPTSVISRQPTAETRAAPPGRTPPAGYYGYEGPPRRRRPVWPWVLSILLLLAAAGAAWFAYTKIQDQLDANQPVSVPFVKGLTESLAVDKLRAAGLVPQVARDFSDTVEKGTVIDQSPDPGEKVAKHNNVDITVSKGKETVQVPSVIGKSRDDAISTLVNAGLDPHAFDVASSKAIGTVTAQDPPPGKVVEKGSRVRVNVSSGPADVTVPSVIGLTYESATTTLRNQGFLVSRTDVDSEKPLGIVVDQSPSGSAPKGTTIQLSVSKGPKESSVPDVTSQDEDSARSTLEDAGFTVTVTRQSVSDPGLDGIVLSQSPTGGTKAKQGSTVRIVVGQLIATEPPPPPPATP
jgi:eukaryotic-like serine/threonine-protein kinase